MEDYTWNYIKKHPQQTKRLLGIDYAQLVHLIEQGKLSHRRKQEKIEKEKIRIIKAGGGNSPKLPEEQQIVLMLIYLRHHLSFQVLGLLFQVSESTAHNLFNYWQNIFQEELPPSLLEQVKKSPEERGNICEELVRHELIVDSAEQEMEKPSDYETQKKYSSGKQKRHTFKNQFIVLPKGADIVDVVVGQPGPTSDITICRRILNKFSPQQFFSGDKAYLGEVQITTPVKKTPNGELTSEQKEENKTISSKRIFVEHVIRNIKTFKISRERFCRRKTRYIALHARIFTNIGMLHLLLYEY